MPVEDLIRAACSGAKQITLSDAAVADLRKVLRENDKRGRTLRVTAAQAHEFVRAEHEFRGSLGTFRDAVKRQLGRGWQR